MKLKNIFKKRKKGYIKLGVNVVDCKSCQKDSIAHTIRNHFDREYIDNHLLMKPDSKNKKILVSKKQFRYLMSLVNVTELLGTYDFEFIDEITLDDL